MEVVGAVASCIALAQGLDAGVKMVSFLKGIPDIQKDFEALQKEIKSTKGILWDSQKYAEVCPDVDDSSRLNEAIQELKDIERELSDFATGCSRVKPTQKEKAKKGKWILEAAKLEKLRRKLADAKTNLQFAVTSHHAMTMDRRTASMAIEMASIFKHVLLLAPPPPAPETGRVEELLEEVGDKSRVAEEIKEGSDCGSKDDDDDDGDGDDSDSEQQIANLEPKSLEPRQPPLFDDARIDQLRERFYGSRAGCPPGCGCRCHFGTTEYRTQPRLRALLGSFSLSCNTVPGPARTECTEPRCKRGGSVTFMLEHRFPTWFWAGVLSFKASYDVLAGFRYSSSLRPCRLINLNDNVWFLGNDLNAWCKYLESSQYHLEDITVPGYGIIEDALDKNNLEVVELLLRLWKNLLAEKCLPRRAGYAAVQWLSFENNDWETHVLRQVLELSGLEMTTTKLHSAIINGESLQSIQAALQQEPWSIDLIGNRGRAPIHDVIERNQVEALGELISAGADIDLRDYKGWTPLMLAANFNSVECMQRLLRAGCNVRLQNEEGGTALHVAAAFGSAEGVSKLLDAGASVSARNLSGQSPVHELARSSQGTSDKLVHLQTALDFDLEATDIRGRTPVILAIICRNATALRCLVDAGASLLAVTHSSNNILHLAALLSNLDVLHYLTSRTISGINTELSDSAGSIPWDSLQFAIHAPQWILGSSRRPSRDEQEAFEQLYQDIRNRNLQIDIQDIDNVLQSLSLRSQDASRAKLASIIQQKQEWRRLDLVETLQDIDHRIQEGEWESATNALNDVVQEMNEEMESSPWEKTSRWDYLKTETEEDYSDEYGSDNDEDDTDCDISMDSNGESDGESTGSDYEDATSQPNSSRRGSLGEDGIEGLVNTQNTG
ncbi:ankyrin repeat-containing domain protein [Dactylonectria macrodidyma]|uniref:Ankyrin repeat-containing domain protein n=1 Tax=Dactylonectria macrodidyma TaxID=307937 RepID=A0A9P9E1L4_9HYPO|nr:ankyrin repeat-containing domain protein [Dactylonectria macrodidyma]